MNRFGRKEAFLGAALSVFGTGCAENSSSDIKDKEKDVNIEKAPLDLINHMSDPDLIIPKDVSLKTDIGNDKNETKNLEQVSGADVEMEKQYRNVLMEEADGVKPGNWMEDGYEQEVIRLKNKLPIKIWENKFNSSPEQLLRFFVPRQNEVKSGVDGLLFSVNDGKDTSYKINKEYRNKVKGFAEKYGAKYGVPVEVIYGLMAVENAGKHDPRKNKADGAYGIMQVQPGVIEEMKRVSPEENWSGLSVEDLEGNIRLGTAYLAYLYNRFGQWSFALMAYNSGPGKFENRMAGGEEKKIKIRKGIGWKGFLKEKNLWWACSKNGRGFSEVGNANYAVVAMYTGPLLQKIIESETEDVTLEWPN